MRLCVTAAIALLLCERETIAKENDSLWWSLVPEQVTVAPTLGEQASEWSENEIDHFVWQRLEEVKIKPSPRAEPRILLRRLYFDLIGLPPPPGKVKEFSSDPSEEKYIQIIEELLASPHYGERWARHWLDVARYGESNGFEYNESRKTAWPYRDWVIRALNEDLPYDQFARMQLAGDIIAPDNGGSAAVGFLVAGVHNTVLPGKPIQKKQARAEELEEIVGTVGQAFLGLTLHCARCHDHKVDPIPTEEYYALAAAFSGVFHGERKVQVADTAKKKRVSLQRERVALQDRLTKMVAARNGLVSKTANQIWLKQPVPANAEGTQYRVSFKVAPSVWANATQATKKSDGVLVQILRADDTVLAAHSARPGAWENGKNVARYRLQTFDYEGDGSGAIRIHLRPFPINSNRFGGAVDDLEIVATNNSAVVFKETFDHFKQPNNPGAQAHTRHRVFFGATSERWEHSGINAIHAAEHTNGNLALQLFSGHPGETIARAETPDEKQLQANINSLNKKLAALPAAGERKIFTVLAKQPEPMKVHLRGNVATLGKEVPPGGVAAVRGITADFKLTSSASDAERRKAAANWISHKDNPLFARVAVNRIWAKHFGTGIVATPNDFGANGALPTHPKLLDWLAVKFRAEGYSTKSMHRIILRSATYRQQSASRPGALAIDDSSTLLWRFPPARVDAEVLRDSILYVSGTLNTKAGGPGYEDTKEKHFNAGRYYLPIDPEGEEFNRRTVYRFSPRGGRPSLLDVFDSPNPSSSCPQRQITTTPTQALSLHNNPFVWRNAARFAERLKRESVGDPYQSIKLAWELALDRQPDDEELSYALKILKKQGLPALCRTLFNCSEFVLIE